MNRTDLIKRAIESAKCRLYKVRVRDSYSINHQQKAENQTELMNITIEALEKQIPKKPIYWEEQYYDSPVPNDNWGYECPCCGNQDIDYPEHHCICGQALDWSEEE